MSDLLQKQSQRDIAKGTNVKTNFRRTCFSFRAKIKAPGIEAHGTSDEETNARSCKATFSN